MAAYAVRFFILVQVCCFPPFHLGLTVVAPLAEAVHVVLSDREYVLERSAVVLLVECSNLVPVLDLSVELLHLRETEASLRTYSFRISGHRRHLFFHAVLICLPSSPPVKHLIRRQVLGQFRVAPLLQEVDAVGNLAVSLVVPGHFVAERKER